MQKTFSSSEISKMTLSEINKNIKTLAKGINSRTAKALKWFKANNIDTDYYKQTSMSWLKNPAKAGDYNYKASTKTIKDITAARLYLRRLSDLYESNLWSVKTFKKTIKERIKELNNATGLNFNQEQYMALRDVAMSTGKSEEYLSEIVKEIEETSDVELTEEEYVNKLYMEAYGFDYDSAPASYTYGAKWRKA